MIWNKSAVDAPAVKEIARRYDLEVLAATILSRRGITAPEAVRFFLEDDARLLHNPFMMQSMAEAVERIGAAIESGEKILIFGDRDVDGITATVLLFEALTELGAEVEWMLPEGEESYGLTDKVIEKAAEAGIGLLVTVDCGVSNTAEIALAASRGIETVVIDHHNPPAELPPALAVVDPKIPGYPFRDLCGCAVAFKTDWALRFSRSSFYGVSFCLLNVRPANETFVIEAVRLVNLVERERITEVIVPGLVAFEKTRLAGFFAGDEIIVLDAEAQGRFLQRAFGQGWGQSDGPGSEMPLSDIGPLVAQFLPKLAGKGLLKIQQEFPSARYSSRPLTEIETLVDVFQQLVLARTQDLLAPAFSRLDLVTLGTLADLMPLVDENRILVRLGLAALRAPSRHGLRQVFKRKDLLGKRISTTDIAWQVAPLLNSAGRMGEPGTATRLFLSKTIEEADTLVEQLCGLDNRRRSLGESAWNLLVDQAKQSLEKTGGRCILVHDGRIQRGITGIMASRLQGAFKVPAIVITETGDIAVGSMRCNRDHVIADFFARHGSLFLNYGGHDFAGGFSLERAKLDEFLESFFSRIEEIELREQGEESLTVDAEIPLSYLTPDLQKIVDLFEPYGEGNQQLLFMTRGVKVVGCELIGRKELCHLKLLFDAGKSKWPAVYWNSSARFQRDFSIGDTVDIAYRLGRNTYGGGENLQLTILDLRK